MDKQKVKKKAKPGPRPIPKALRAALAELNEAVRAQIRKDRRKKPGPTTRADFFKWRDLLFAYHRYNGKCAFCGQGVQMGMVTPGPFQVKFIPITPFSKGGQANSDNLYPVCWFHYKRYLPRRKAMERVPGVDSLADLIVALSKTVKLRENLRVQGKGDEYLIQTDKIDRLKSEINSLFEEVAVYFQYRIFSEEMPRKVEPRIEGENSLADLIEKEDTEEIVDGLKEIHYTGRYRLSNNKTS